MASKLGVRVWSRSLPQGTWLISHFKSLGGSCNNAPIGVIPSVDNMPSAKFIFPPNFAALTKAETFTVKIAISHLDTGHFTNVETTFMAGPVEVNTNGDIIGHSHIVIEKLTGFGQTIPTDPKNFAYFGTLNNPAVNGVLTADVPGGLPAGFYRISTFHTGANHQPCTYTSRLVLRTAQDLTRLPLLDL
jgi:hypothetical protein